MPLEKAGPASGQAVAALDTLLDEYYQAFGYTADGVPTPEKLEELGLEPLAEDFPRCAPSDPHLLALRISEWHGGGVPRVAGSGETVFQSGWPGSKKPDQIRGYWLAPWSVLQKLILGLCKGGVHLSAQGTRCSGAHLPACRCDRP